MLEIDMMPEYSFNDLEDILKRHREIMTYTEELFAGILNKRISQVIIKNSVDVKMNEPVKNLSDTQIKKIAGKTKAFKVTCDGTMSWNNAQVTAGGIATQDFFSDAMESRLQKGLFACGEILDVDGDCGGYNLQWAWSSGFVAGKNAARVR